MDLKSLFSRLMWIMIFGVLIYSIFLKDAI